MNRETVIIIRPNTQLAVVNTNSLREFDHLIELGYDPSFFTSKQGRKEVTRGTMVTFQIPKQEIVIKRTY